MLGFAAFVLLVAILFLLRDFVSSYLRRISPPPGPPPMAARPPPAAPVQVGELTAAELRAYDGSDASKPLLLACLGDIFDVSIGADFYGPGGPYGCFAGREANRALAKMSLKAEDCVPDVEGLSLMETDILRDWKTKFETKYTKMMAAKWSRMQKAMKRESSKG